MRLLSFVIAGLALTDGVLGGSRLWEAKAPNRRAGVVPAYNPHDAPETLNATVPLARRAMSIKNSPGAVGARRIWPNKKMKYCFDDRDDTIVELFELAKATWQALTEHGFSYEEVSGSACTGNNRKEVLMVHFNNNGRLASTMGIPPNDPRAEGPTMHLSNRAGIGQNDIKANVGHELGHAWGLHHEHQNRDWWKTSTEHTGDPFWGAMRSNDPHFQTNKFFCENLSDYATALAKAQAAARENPSTHGSDPEIMCKSMAVASDYDFSAMEWLPVANSAHFDTDDTFDEDSLMMYPSQAGGRGNGASRLIVMKYQDDTIIPPRLVPSDMDIQRLLTLYGSENSSPPGEPHGSKVSGVKGAWRKIRTKFHRAGDTGDMPACK
ncbi:hypothetical protein F5X68DRAFT_171356 [Plectosphaerella plurivora]|uniref:Peptidase metallopeptidase domain-containing protein n=1 Tax=Plectosphaerella plurivora TaxID=936078 RepID=A0A9P9A9C4_9PEZI|nr:hypothetical protein F5X68DRAFT_171356 [Plectosphaerella plurivora]